MMNVWNSRSCWMLCHIFQLFPIHCWATVDLGAVAGTSFGEIWSLDGGLVSWIGWGRSCHGGKCSRSKLYTKNWSEIMKKQTKLEINTNHAGFRRRCWDYSLHVAVYTCGREHIFFSYRFIPDAMASQKVKVRLVADPSISVSDLVQCFECWIDENGVTKDVLAWWGWIAFIVVSLPQ